MFLQNASFLTMNPHQLYMCINKYHYTFILVLLCVSDMNATDNIALELTSHETNGKYSRRIFIPQSYEAKKVFILTSGDKHFCYYVMRKLIPVPKTYDTTFEMVAFT